MSNIGLCITLFYSCSLHSIFTPHHFVGSMSSLLSFPLISPPLFLLVLHGCGLRLAAGAVGGLPDVSLCRIGPRGLLLKRSSVLHLQIALHDHFLLPTHSSQAALCAKAEKSSNRGVQYTQGLSTGPYSSSPQSSSPLLHNQTSAWLYFKIHKYSPLG